MTGKFKDLFDKRKPAAPGREPVDQPARPTRSKGKRSDPAYEQVTAYVRRETYRGVKIALLEQGSPGYQFSDLVEELLTEWLRTRKSK